jgi:hypothetical protein
MAKIATPRSDDANRSGMRKISRFRGLSLGASGGLDY